MELHPPQKHGLPADHGKTGTATSPTGTLLWRSAELHLSPSASHAILGAHSWKETHNNPGKVHSKATASHQIAQHLSRNLNMRPLPFGLCLRQKLCGGIRDGSSQNTSLRAGKKDFSFFWVVGFFFPLPFWLALDFYSEFEMQTLLQATEPRESPVPGACGNTVLCCTSYLKQHWWTTLELHDMLQKVIKNPAELHEIREKQHIPVPDTNTHFTVFTLWGIIVSVMESLISTGKKTRGRLQPPSSCRMTRGFATELPALFQHSPTPLHKTGRERFGKNPGTSTSHC